VGLANAVVAFYIFMLVPEYLLRFIAWLPRAWCTASGHGDDNIPVQGAAILVCNHVSFVDAVLLMAASPRPIRFVMDHRIFKVPVLGWLFKLAKAIPIAPRKEDPAAYEAAFDVGRRSSARRRPAGDLSGRRQSRTTARCRGIQGRNHEDHGARRRRRRAGAGDSMALTNLWGSYFSRIEKGGAMVAAVPAWPVQPGGSQTWCSGCARESRARSSYTPRWRNCSREQLPEAGPIRQRQAPPPSR